MNMGALVFEDGRVPEKSKREKLPFMLMHFRTVEESIKGVKQRGYGRG